MARLEFHLKCFSSKNVMRFTLFQFDFENCKFVVQRAKEGTGRVVMKQLGVQYSYTLEASVCGTLTGSDSSLVQTHFSIQDYQEICHVFCETLANFFNPIPTRVSRSAFIFLFSAFETKKLHNNCCGYILFANLLGCLMTMWSVTLFNLPVFLVKSIFLFV
jgi:hypothetical protein